MLISHHASPASPSSSPLLLPSTSTSPSPPPPPPPPPPETTFYSQEILRSLKEAQIDGLIGSYELTSSTASAKIILLEGTPVSIQCLNDGFRVIRPEAGGNVDEKTRAKYTDTDSNNNNNGNRNQNEPIDGGDSDQSSNAPVIKSDPIQQSEVTSIYPINHVTTFDTIQSLLLNVSPLSMLVFNETVTRKLEEAFLCGKFDLGSRRRAWEEEERVEDGE